MQTGLPAWHKGFDNALTTPRPGWFPGWGNR